MQYVEQQYTTLNDHDYEHINKHFKIIKVDWFDKIQVNSATFTMDKSIQDIVSKMSDFYLNHEDKAIYKKTDYLCNRKERICICNTHAKDFRKIYDGINYTDDNYVSWIKMKRDPF